MADNKKVAKFHCEKCNYKCSKLSDWNKHITRQKHLNESDNDNDSIKTYTCICGNVYAHISGLSRHKKTCDNISDNDKDNDNYNDNDNNENEYDNDNDNKEIIDKPVKPELDVNAIVEIVKLQIQDNMELRKMLVEQNQQMMELCKNIGASNSYNNNNNMIHSNNKTFNLQFFLNEQCKNALNLTEFINSIKPTLSDLEATGELGYVEGISRVFVKELNRLDQFTRPIHCSDIKRETLYIKDDDKWEKEPKDNPRLNSAIRYVAGRNISNIGEWVQSHPGCTYSDSKFNNKYSNIVSNAMSGETESEQEKNIQKIIQNITKQVIIDKK